MCRRRKFERIDGRADGTEQEKREPKSRSKYTIEVKEWQPQDAARRVSNSRWRDRRSREKRHGTIVSNGFQRPSGPCLEDPERFRSNQGGKSATPGLEEYSPTAKESV